jgi:Electron transfer DM13
MMFRKIQTGIAIAMLLSVMGFEHVSAQEKTKALETGTFHGRVHNTSGRATIYKEADGRVLLRLTNFKTSKGPDVHVVLIAAKDADNDANFLKSSTERIEIGRLKGNEGDQNYDIPAGTDLKKFQTVSIYCERFNLNSEVKR